MVDGGSSGGLSSVHSSSVHSSTHLGGGDSMDGPALPPPGFGDVTT